MIELFYFMFDSLLNPISNIDRRHERTKGGEIPTSKFA